MSLSNARFVQPNSKFYLSDLPYSGIFWFSLTTTPEIPPMQYCTAMKCLFINYLRIYLCILVLLTGFHMDRVSENKTKQTKQKNPTPQLWLYTLKSCTLMYFSECPLRLSSFTVTAPARCGNMWCDVCCSSSVMIQQRGQRISGRNLPDMFSRYVFPLPLNTNSNCVMTSTRNS